MLRIYPERGQDLVRKRVWNLKEGDVRSVEVSWRGRIKLLRIEFRIQKAIEMTAFRRNLGAIACGRCATNHAEVA